MHHLILTFILASAAWGNPPYLAIRTDASGVIVSYHATSDPVPSEGMTLVPWVDFSRSDLVPRPGKQRSVSHHKLVGGVLQRRTDQEIDADDLAARQKAAKGELRELKKQRRDLADDVRAGDADQGDLDALDAKIIAKRAEIQGMR